MKKLLLVSVILCTAVLGAEKVSVSGKAGVSIWYEDYERKGLGAIYWFSDSIGTEVTLNFDTTAIHDYSFRGYAGKIKLPIVITRQDNALLELTPEFFYRRDPTQNPNLTITYSPGLWLLLELFPVDAFKNISFSIGGGVDLSYVVTETPTQTTTLNQINISVFALGVKYYF
ncbi:MAG: hypothetical protein A2452_12655 [Candidatus Firestonebacteria bacterium RIFOXYC2_FULL_39_67]|nr:MAG: hypothetical protein A2536_12020 [Candidatus Firestonebacteria bacterium RIFOXYD2_FULL_39_29]OGF52838.1 MAG: hypothetical protein A2497_01050 [Candidatus Firestonebacteria bacterium RifOxyC12_full_39_7]OGF57414.1 MAG: hypothetical protein A2452_12655 [Candidatus Firestonebacteria bacterium RIFOXYC2_FULL_39_67]